MRQHSAGPHVHSTCRRTPGIGSRVQSLSWRHPTVVKVPWRKRRTFADPDYSKGSVGLGQPFPRPITRLQVSNAGTEKPSQPSEFMAATAFYVRGVILINFPHRKRSSRYSRSLTLEDSSSRRVAIFSSLPIVPSPFLVRTRGTEGSGRRAWEALLRSPPPKLTVHWEVHALAEPISRLPFIALPHSLRLNTTDLYSTRPLNSQPKIDTCPKCRVPAVTVHALALNPIDSGV